MSRVIRFPFSAESDGRGDDARRGRVAYVVHTDELTGFYDRQVSEDRLRLEMARSKRRGGSLSAMVLAVDRFEQLKETKGDEVVSGVLVSIARCLQETARITDAVGQWGADQFCLILPDTELRAATLIADHLREMLADQSFTDGSGEDFQITCTIGVAQWNRSRETTREFPERLERTLASQISPEGFFPHGSEREPVDNRRSVPTRPETGASVPPPPLLQVGTSDPDRETRESRRPEGRTRFPRWPRLHRTRTALWHWGSSW